MHPPYSWDLTSYYYYIFLSMANDIAGEKFVSRVACEKRLFQVFVNRNEVFYESVFIKLPLQMPTTSKLNKTLNLM